MDIDGLEHQTFVSSAVGDWLTAECGLWRGLTAGVFMEVWEE